LKATPKQTRSSPLATTITRIAGVVPTSVRILIGLLFALAFVLGLRTRLAALYARRLERQRGQLLEDVGLLQAALLPVLPARIGPVGTSAAYRPASGPAAGGDFYDVFALDDGRLAVILGDISGHGRQALHHTALVRFTLRAYLEAGLSPRGTLQTASDVLERQLGDAYATVVLATYQPRDRTLVYACAGHPPPVVLGSAPLSRSLGLVTACSSPPLGIGRRTGTRQTTLSVAGQSQLCFYTDGVTEAWVGEQLFGEGRLAETLTELGPDASASELLDRVAEKADRHHDDMAACVLSVQGSADAPRVLIEEIELDREDSSSDRAERFLDVCGVSAGEIPEVLRGIRDGADHAGNVILRVRLGDGPPRPTIQYDNLTNLPARRASRQATAGVSQ
jgi:serine phosphatase RsbU (regulator of sigma subunit)